MVRLDAEAVMGIVAPRAISWGTSGPFLFDTPMDANTYIQTAPGEASYGDVFDDARGAWPRDIVSPLYVLGNIRDDNDLTAAMGEAWLDHKGINGLPGFGQAVDSMVMRNPGLMNEMLLDRVSRRTKGRIDDNTIRQQLVLELATAQEDWPFMNQVYDVVAGDMAEVTRSEDWDRPMARQVLDGWSRRQVALEKLAQRR